MIKTSSVVADTGWSIIVLFDRFWVKFLQTPPLKHESFKSWHRDEKQTVVRKTMATVQQLMHLSRILFSLTDGRDDPRVNEHTVSWWIYSQRETYKEENS